MRQSLVRLQCLWRGYIPSDPDDDYRGVSSDVHRAGGCGRAVHTDVPQCLDFHHVAARARRNALVPAGQRPAERRHCTGRSPEIYITN